MDRRVLLFIALSAAVLIVHAMLRPLVQPPPPPAAAQRAANGERAPDGKDKDKDRAKDKDPAKDKDRAGKQADGQPAAPDKAGAEAKPAPAEAAELPETKREPLEWVTLGSVDESSPYRMLVTLTNKGAAVERIELSSSRFRDLDDRSGYLGHLHPAAAKQPAGCLARVVGPGTPADKARLKAKDVITAVNGKAVAGPAGLEAALARTKPGDTSRLSVMRGGKQLELTAKLTRRPLEVIRPEGADQLSYLLTLDRIGDRKIEDDAQELPGLSLRTGNWKLLPRKAGKSDEASFEWVLPRQQLRIVKNYRLAKVTDDKQEEPAYHLEFDIEIHNLGAGEQSVAYRLDGPTGLPTEGSWYAYSSKISPVWWDSPGLRDVVVGFAPQGILNHRLVSASKIIDGKVGPPWQDEPLVYIGVDAQYFSSVLIPRQEDPLEVRYAKAMPIKVGPVPDDKDKRKLTNVSSRLISKPVALEPGDKLVRNYRIFAGPKQPDLLAQYAQPFELNELVYYGWFGWVSRPMLKLLHGFYWLVGNYGLAIIMLTVLVRLCMFPLSRKQALGAQKMQELQPEMKRLTEKFKDPQLRHKAQQELFRKHNYNPLSGCLPALIQLPIFLGLYRSLSVDVELRDAPLISHAIRWCSNLAAPDMLWNWEPFLPGFLAAPTGWLGPFLNVLPLVTVALFIWQQKMFMPPPADEQAAMQQKIMQYMMIVIGVMFFKVASGLCVYFIASSVWGIAERKLLPKTIGKKPSAPPPPRAGAGAPKPAPKPASPNGNGTADRKKPKQRGRK